MSKSRYQITITLTSKDKVAFLLEEYREHDRYWKLGPMHTFEGKSAIVDVLHDGYLSREEQLKVIELALKGIK